VVWHRRDKDYIREIVEKLNKEINAAIADPGMKPAVPPIGGEALKGSPAAFGKLISKVTENDGQSGPRGRIKRGVRADRYH